MRPRLVVALLALSLCAAARSARADDAARFRELEEKVTAAFAAKDYEQAAALCREQIALVPKESGPHYNLACALARTGKADEAFESLRRSADLGFDDPEHMKADEDLATLRSREGFAAIVAKAAENEKKAEAGTYDAPVEVEGVETVESKEGQPEGGLRWRLRKAAGADPKKPQRLLVWLHPSGGSMNDVVERLAPRLAAKGWALLVPTEKRWDAWREGEAARLLDKSVPDVVATVPGIDATRPVLMGFSAGGQMALEMWGKDPGRFGGLVLDAAYPLDMTAYRAGRPAVRPLPEGEGVKKTPFFVVVGDADDGSWLWKEAEKPWRAGGVPLTVEYVAGGKHAWLFGPSQTDALTAWLGEVAAGGLPGAPAPK